jgi:hypothetical protein
VLFLRFYLRAGFFARLQLARLAARFIRFHRLT